jgi:hypothetical protein
MWLGLFLVRVLIPFAPVVGVLSFFLLKLQQSSSEGYARNVTPCRILVIQITSFLSLIRGWRSLSLMEV